MPSLALACRLSAVSMALRQAYPSAFSPSSLFASGEQGLWYDVGDFDRYMSELGPELVTGINSAAAWTPYYSNIVENDSGAVKITFVNSSDGAYVYLGSGALSTNLTVGRHYAISGLAKVSAGSSVNISSNSGYGAGLNYATIRSTEYVRFTFSILSSSPSLNLLKFLNMGVGESIWVTDISVRELTAINTATLFQDAAGTIPVTAVEQPVGRILDLSGRGNHASQATTTARGVLRARYNLLTYSEDFSNAAWVKSGSPTLTNLGAGIWRLQAIAGSSWLLYQRIQRPSAESCKFTIEVKSNGGGSNFRTMQKGMPNTSVTATTEWTRISTTPGSNDGSGDVGMVFDAANSEIDILIRFPDLRPANLPASLPPYQRIAAATDYDTVGFPVYIDPDGMDDSYKTGNIDFTGTDKMTIWAGLRKVDDSSRILCELSANVNNNAGSFYFVTGLDGAPTTLYSTTARGSALANWSHAGGFNTGLYPAPDHAVLTAQHDISGDLSRIRRNGSSSGAIDGTADKGTGNFGNYPLYLFSRGGTSLRWKGQFYGLIIRGAATDTTQLEQTEQWLNSKMGGVY